MMKKVFKTTVVFFLLIGVKTLAAQDFNDFSKSLLSGDVQEISSHLADEVEVIILDDSSYSKVEAEDLLASFFSESSDNEFKAIHKGRTKENAQYQIGELRSKNITYRTYLYSRNIDGNFKIQEFRIER